MTKTEPTRTDKIRYRLVWNPNTTPTAQLVDFGRTVIDQSDRREVTKQSYRTMLNDIAQWRKGVRVDEVDYQFIVKYDQLLKDRRVAHLTATDYIAAKIAEGKATKTEYTDNIAERQTWRDDINAANAEIERLKTIEPNKETPMEE